MNATTFLKQLERKREIARKRAGQAIATRLSAGSYLWVSASGREWNIFRMFDDNDNPTREWIATSGTDYLDPADSKRAILDALAHGC